MLVMRLNKVLQYRAYTQGQPLISLLKVDTGFADHRSIRPVLFSSHHIDRMRGCGRTEWELGDFPHRPWISPNPLNFSRNTVHVQRPPYFILAEWGELGVTYFTMRPVTSWCFGLPTVPAPCKIDMRGRPTLAWTSRPSPQIRKFLQISIHQLE